MEGNQHAAEMRFPEELWGEIHRLMGQPDFLETQVALARTSHKMHVRFGGYLFAPDQDALNAAMAYTGEAKAIVLAANGLEVNGTPTCVAPDGQPTPIVSYGSDTTIASGFVYIQDAAVTASGTASVGANSGSKVTASGNALVSAFSGSTVIASGNALVSANEGSTVTASGNARVKAWSGSTVTGQGSEVVIFSFPGANVTADDREHTVYETTDDDQYLSYEELEAQFAAQQ